MKQGVGIQLQQKNELAMTTGLREAIEMLQLSALEVETLISGEIADNPCLEYEDRADGLAEVALRDTAAGRDEGEGGWDVPVGFEVNDSGAGGPLGADYGSSYGGTDSDDEGVGWEARAHAEPTLQEFLTRQFDQIVVEPKLRLVGHFLIDAIDEAGYLRADLPAVATQLRVNPDVVDDARAILQTLEPTGVGARDLAECLRLQLHAAGQLDDVCDVCLAHLDWVAARAWDKLAAEVNRLVPKRECDADEVRLAVAEMMKCNPKPAAGFMHERVESVVVDVVVTRNQESGIRNQEEGGVFAGVKPLEGWKVELNGAAFPRLLVQNLEAGRDKAAQKYVQERMGRAKWLVNALEQRAKSTLAVAKAVVAAQRQFMDAGAEFMVPLTLREVAETVGVHESTVSRVVNGKFMQTPWGVIPLRTFFASGVASTGGNVGVASRSVQALIAKLVKAEDPKKPLSDEQIVLRLKDEGVEVARRTVAKYRGVLNIPGTAERRLR